MRSNMFYREIHQIIILIDSNLTCTTDATVFRVKNTAEYL